MVNKKVFKIIWDINLEDFKEILAFLANKTLKLQKL